MNNTTTYLSKEEQILDQRLRDHMLSIYKYMTIASLITGLTAYAVGNNITLMNIFFSNAITANIVIFSPLIFVLSMNFGFNKLSFASLQAIFWLYSFSVGVSISTIFIIYTSASIAKVFFISSSLFASMSLYGYTTKNSLVSWGSFLYMAVFGIVIAMIINFFTASSAISYLISCLAVIIFSALTAYETQQIKNFYFNNGISENDNYKKITIMFALSLYLNMLNIFLHLLRILGSRR